MDDVMDSIFDVWAEADDVREYGTPYVEHMIATDLERLHSDDGSDEQAVRAMSDIAINAIRSIHAMTDEDPKEHILQRLETRKQGDTERVVEEYLEGYRRSRE